MERKTWNKMAAGIGLAAWALHRNEKYPIVKELRFMNKFFVPGFFLTKNVAVLGNRTMRKMKSPKVPKDVQKETKWILSFDNKRIRLTVYTPDGMDEQSPCLVYYHGGGFCFADAWYIHENVIEYARDAKCKIVFVHYRTSDKVAFPVPFQDCCAGLKYVWEHSEKLGINKTRIAVGGDSAGGALAAACSIWARDEADIPLCFQLLIYPVTDCRMQTKSMKEYVDCPCWNSRLNARMWDLYLRKGDVGQLQYAAPILAESLAELPPAYVEVEEFDCLRDEGIAYAKALQEAGVSVHLESMKGTFHGFDVFRNSKIVKKVMKKRSNALAEAFEK